MLRVARVLRILRLVKNLKGLRDLALTLVYAFPALVNVGTLLFVVTFIYGVLGMNLFCRVQHQENISDERNFESFGNAVPDPAPQPKPPSHRPLVLNPRPELEPEPKPHLSPGPAVPQHTNHIPNHNPNAQPLP